MNKTEIDGKLNLQINSSITVNSSSAHPPRGADPGELAFFEERKKLGKCPFVSGLIHQKLQKLQFLWIYHFILTSLELHVVINHKLLD